MLPGAGWNCCLTRLSSLSPYGETDAFCSPRCSSATQCRTPGYACYFFVSAGANACWLNPIPTVAPDAGFADGGTSSSIGAACVNSQQCTATANAFCIPDIAPTGGATGFVGGYCSTSCSGVPCSTGSTCTPVSGALGTFPVCLQNCASPRIGQSSCRNGYICEGTTGTSSGYCLPRCNNTGATCPTGTACNATSGYCG